MIQKELSIQNKLGLHARASAKMTQTTGKFACEVWLTCRGRRVNGKSIMGVMMLAAGVGSVLGVECIGVDEALAMVEIEALVNDLFGEGQ